MIASENYRIFKGDWGQNLFVRGKILGVVGRLLARSSLTANDELAFASLLETWRRTTTFQEVSPNLEAQVLVPWVHILDLAPRERMKSLRILPTGCPFARSMSATLMSPQSCQSPRQQVSRSADGGAFP